MPPRSPRLALAALIATLAIPFGAMSARAETACPELTADLRGMTLKYQRIMTDMQDARRALAYLPRGEEAVIRAVGRFASLTSAARAERERILALYRTAVSQECWQFEQASLEQTQETFARATAGEEETLTGTRRVLSGVANVIK
ncbi:hypothetical protein SLNSH_13885 [Alsobacter soli]|uniref:Uncharacterized protein n=1 Tax=Alsobacter soli TaxID=2109933 RepID=A0A2T1HRQ6_9HYPH|nr:hypothetical protein [Alsobacter soli]PSC04317.1 hypothetical protein SLNSH_13885 [Alsobacter soli]